MLDLGKKWNKKSHIIFCKQVRAVRVPGYNPAGELPVGNFAGIACFDLMISVLLAAKVTRLVSEGYPGRTVVETRGGMKRTLSGCTLQAVAKITPWRFTGLTDMHWLTWLHPASSDMFKNVCYVNRSPFFYLRDWLSFPIWALVLPLSNEGHGRFPLLCSAHTHPSRTFSVLSEMVGSTFVQYRLRTFVLHGHICLILHYVESLALCVCFVLMTNARAWVLSKEKGLCS